MTQSDESPRPSGVEEPVSADAGTPSESGSEATEAAIASPDPCRLSLDEVVERDEQFSGPRKSQGPLIEEEEGTDSTARTEESVSDASEETPVPEAPSGADEDDSS
jgi:hypothetical protein